MAISQNRKLTGREFRGGRHRTVSTPYFAFKARENGADGVRIGVVVGASVHKSAVKRNFWKRQARETVRSLSGARGDLLLILFPKVNSLTKKQFREKIISAGAELGFKNI